MTLIVIFILIFLYKSHWSHSTQWLKNIRRKLNLKGRDALSLLSQCSDGGLGGFAEQFFVDLRGLRGRKVWFVKCSNKGLCQVPCFATWRIQRVKDWRSFHLLFCWFGNGLSDTHTIPSSAASPSTSGFASALVRSGLWGHCGFEIFKRKGNKEELCWNPFHNTWLYLRKTGAGVFLFDYRPHTALRTYDLHSAFVAGTLRVFTIYIFLFKRILAYLQRRTMLVLLVGALRLRFGRCSWT